MKIKSIVIVKRGALDAPIGRGTIMVGELPGPYPTEADAVAALIDGQSYKIQDGVMYAEQSLREARARSDAARALGAGSASKAGAAGRGEAKRRGDSSHYRALAVRSAARRQAMMYRVEGQADGGEWSDEYAGDDAAGIRSMRAAREYVAAIRRNEPRDEWAGPWRIVRESDNRVMAEWAAKRKRQE